MEPGAAELYDQALLGILQHVGNVQDFLRVLFGFLYRKTDFYRLLRHPSDRMGFPPGAAQALVLQVMRGRREARGGGRWRGGGRPWEPRPRPRPPRARPRSPRLSGSPDPCEPAAPSATGLSSSSGAAPDQPSAAAASADMLLGYQFTPSVREGLALEQPGPTGCTWISEVVVHRRSGPGSAPATCNPSRCQGLPVRE